MIEEPVIEALVDQLLQPERVTSILLALKARRDERQAAADRRIVDPARQTVEAEDRLNRLYAAIEVGTIDGTDPSLKERIAALRASRDRAIEALEYARKTSGSLIEIDPVAIKRPVGCRCCLLRDHFRDRLLDTHAGNPGDDIVQALDVPRYSASW